MNGNDRSLVLAIRGPVTLITLGSLFALNNFTPYGFNRTWPILLIVFGLLTLLRRGIEPVPPPQPVAPPWSYQPAPPPPPVTPSSTSYRQSTYSEPAPPAAAPSEASKGGFGTSAPPKPNEPGPGTPTGGTL